MDFLALKIGSFEKEFVSRAREKNTIKNTMVQELKETDYKRLKFVVEMTERFKSFHIIFSDEAHFTLTGHFNKQNSVLEQDESPAINTKHVTLRNTSVTVWAGLASSFSRTRQEMR